MRTEINPDVQLLKDLEILTDRYGSYSLATTTAEEKMRAVVASFAEKLKSRK